MNLNAQAINTPWSEEIKKQEESFLEDCACAKVVSTAQGDALLINGKVLFVHGPDNWGYANLIAKALRMVAGKESGGASA
ncbi:MAG: hypothetical protein E5X94_00685 [Mesorhizobium sp.]|uniref:hypothetical protein n=1 Tax=unclassified Mesorhizobium TaxID=325217 RepID=UPI000FCA2D5A|nr:MULTISPECIES: hypothetical protein [unclassified Mesorhizobium]RUW04035.1 hypothetical protein EOA49_00465 [Mesorhizobium sp. M1A.F.Ca.IN.020.04.1.1]RUW04098.1 hypothetical protein EOA49_00800 [Mesorhizobium sp. M1A.F.Ca.IN.020.04.1.1]TIN82766.1 MAG: hypothetical protein E5X97_29110 [Mesorhizobium sp.]TIN88354.1 MAG: hypothetical protein E5X94_00685 [Mesorhizobium sp.]TIO82298.1 MAG: hypothetical protein E5Y00_09655 [Mesorhizobium sp.]